MLGNHSSGFDRHAGEDAGEGVGRAWRMKMQALVVL